MRLESLFRLGASLTFVIGAASTALAQSPEPEQEPTRQTTIASAAAEKAKDLHPYEVTKAEKVITRIERRFTNQTIRWHPYLQNAYRGGGFAAGLGYMFHPSSYSTLDVRGSYSIRSYKLAEAEFISPRLFDRRGELTVLGGWRDATEVAFYGVGMNTSTDDRANFGFEQPYGSALLTFRPTRRLFMVRGGFEASRWDLKSGKGSVAVGRRGLYAGVAARARHDDDVPAHAGDRRIRLAPGAAAMRGVAASTASPAHDYTDRDDTLGFRQVDYEVIQHIPILRETWVLSLHGLAKTTWDKGDQATPFYMLPSLGGGSNLRGFSSCRFTRPQQPAAAGGVANHRPTASSIARCSTTPARSPRASPICDFNHLKTDYGFGVRFHSPLATVLRIDVARSNEGTRLVFATSPVSI